MQQVADWLKTLGMSEYAERFAENGITVAALRHLTDQDLKDIGVLLGHRRIILASIGELTGVAPAKPEPAVEAKPKAQQTDERREPPVPVAASSPPVSTRVESAAERRHLTVMFWIWWVRPLFPRSSMQRNGANWLALISTPPRRR